MLPKDHDVHAISSSSQAKTRVPSNLPSFTELRADQQAR
jgi:hypothetical protein